jgi:serine/threonine protein kinase
MLDQFFVSLQRHLNTPSEYMYKQEGDVAIKVRCCKNKSYVIKVTQDDLKLEYDLFRNLEESKKNDLLTFCIFQTVEPEEMRKGHMGIYEAGIQDMATYMFDRDANRTRIAVHLLKGVAFLHSLNFVHRNIKPENIVLTGEGGEPAKLIDFKTAKTLDNVRYLEATGTPAYWSAELAEYSYKSYRGNRAPLGTYAWRRADFCALAISVLLLWDIDLTIEPNHQNPENPEYYDFVLEKFAVRERKISSDDSDSEQAAIFASVLTSALTEKRSSDTTRHVENLATPTEAYNIYLDRGLRRG